MAGSRIVAVRKWLIDSLRDLPAFDDAELDYAWRAASDSQTRVFTTRAEFDHMPSGLKTGRVHRNEDGAFDLVILHFGIDTDPLDTAEHAIGLGALVEEWVADNRHPDVEGVNWVRISGGTFADLFTDSGGYLAELSLRVIFDARLT